MSGGMKSAPPVAAAAKRTASKGAAAKTIPAGTAMRRSAAQQVGVQRAAPAKGTATSAQATAALSISAASVRATAAPSIPAASAQATAAPSAPAASERVTAAQGALGRDNDGYVRSFARGLRVIEALGRGRGGQTVQAIAARTGLPRTVVRRIVLTLTDLGFAVADGSSFLLTPRVMNLGMSYLTSLPFWHVAQHVLEGLCAEIQESVALSLLDGDDVVYLMRMPSRRIMSLRLGAGSRLPAYATSPGRVLLADAPSVQLERYLQSVRLKAYTDRTVTSAAALRTLLSRVRERGYAWVDAELDPAVAGLSVPVRDSRRTVVAALSANLRSDEAGEAASVRKLLRPLQQTADRLCAMAPDFLDSIARSTRASDREA